MKFSSSCAFKLPGKISRLTKERSGTELPTSRQSSTHAIAALKSSGWDSVLGSIRIGSSGLELVRRTWPRLFVPVTTASNVQQSRSELNMARASALKTGVEPPGFCYSSSDLVRLSVFDCDGV